MEDAPLTALARIPAGEFYMGSDAGDDEGPRHRVYVDEFHIGVYAVTNDEYAQFVQDTGRRPPGVHDLPVLVTDGGHEREQTFRRIAAAYAWTEGRPPDSRAVHPVTLVTYEDAAAYCRWLSAATGETYRLPTEAEWEKAARGTEGWTYPWGNDWAAEEKRLNWGDLRASIDGYERTAPVGQFPAGASPWGCLDMAGNVTEWTSDLWDERTGFHRVVKGGSYLEMQLCRLWERLPEPPNGSQKYLGFRCAVSAAAK
jgi:formylglycine-generating enzyme required for sulfatase activity